MNNASVNVVVYVSLCKRTRVSLDDVPPLHHTAS